MDFLICYSYEPVTGEYTGEANAWASPMEQGVYLLPANATFTAPPEPQEGFFRKWNGEAWGFEEIPVAPEPVPPTTEELAAKIRADRNERLRACDWTMLSDAPVTGELKIDWVMYRQALRDVPQQPAFPNAITWPIEP